MSARLSLAGLRLRVTSPHRRSFPCCVADPFRCMPTPLPRRNREVRTSFFFPRGGWPSRSMGSVGFRVFRFEACSAFTARFGLHRRQVAKQPFPPETPTGSSPPPPLRLLTGQERPQPDGIPTRKTTNAFSRRTQVAKDPRPRCQTGRPRGNRRDGANVMPISTLSP